jgi:hypothetical protein
MRRPPASWPATRRSRRCAGGGDATDCASAGDKRRVDPRWLIRCPVILSNTRVRLAPLSAAGKLPSMSSPRGIRVHQTRAASRNVTDVRSTASRSLENSRAALRVPLGMIIARYPRSAVSSRSAYKIRASWTGKLLA